MRPRPLASIALAAGLLLLTSCSTTTSSSETAPASPTSTQSSSTPPATPTTSPAPTAEAAPAPDAAAYPIDRTAAAQAAYDTGVITAAAETEPGRWEISTTIVDPRVDGASQEGGIARGVCEAIVALGATDVVIYEEDGTTFVLYGHPSYGNSCTEV